VVFGGDYKELAASQASGAFAAVFIRKGNYGITSGTIELDCHKINVKLKVQNVKMWKMSSLILNLTF
jgi:hypothetical protein